MKLVVGLGNPGSQYVGTRHNVGFDVVAAVSAAFGGGSPKKKFQGEVCEVTIGPERVLLLQPLTFMNLSGSSVLAARDFHKIAAEDTLVVCDDMALPIGRLRFRASGSSGGQKGLEDILRRLGTDAIPRLRLGVGQPGTGRDAVGHVLGKFAPDEKEAVKDAIKRAAAATADWVLQGIAVCMNKYNAGDSPAEKKPRPEKPERKQVREADAKDTGHETSE